MITTKEINDNIIAQLQSKLNQTVPLLPKSFLRVLAKTLAGVFILLYKYAGFTLLQLFVRTASIAETEVNGRTLSPLIEWGRLIGVGDPAAATRAELIIEVTVEQQGGTLPAGSQLVDSESGVTYITLTAVTLDAAAVTAVVRAVSDRVGGGGAGSIGNMDVGDTLSFANPLSDVAGQAEVLAQIVTGADRESTEAYRQRIIDRFQKRPQGGAYADYEQWGEEPAGTINVYPYTGLPGQVDVYVEATVESSGSPDGIPTTAQLNEVLNSINLDKTGLASRRSANAFVNVYPITRIGFDVRVSGIADVDSLAQVRDDIEIALKGYFLSVEPFIAGLSIPPRNDRITRTRISAIVEEIVTAAGGFFTSATLLKDNIVSENYTLLEGEKAKLISVSFI